MTSFSTDVMTLLPELVLAGGAMALLLFGAVRGEKGIALMSWLAIAVLAVVGYLVVMPVSAANHAFGNAFVVDDFARFAKVLILLGSALALLMAQDFLKSEGLAKFEFPVLVMLATVGMMLMVSASSFIALYMGLELQSLALYVLAAFHRDSLRSTEAGLKYFVLGALSSGMMLYGISLIYGFTGTTDFAGVAAAASHGVGIGLIFGIVFLISGLAFKVSAVPFHMWTPDVYEGAPTPITAFFSMSPKVAAMILFLRAMIEALGPAVHQWQQIVIAVSVLSMVLGAVAAIGQTNIKRLMAYSSIGHMGYALLGLAAATPAGIQGVLIYLAIYLVTNAGVFVCILAMRRDGEPVETIADLAGLARSRPRLAFAFMIFMISLSGIPPFAGFFAKFYVFLAAIQAGLYVPAVIGVVASVVGAYYYWRIFKVIYFDEPAAPFDREMGAPLNFILAGSGAFTLLFIVGAEPLIAAASVAAKAILP
ncbi:MAG TPA: NADH-quinone oxidoreductase subunit NuoN [Rhizomicrobium sp.]|jgi:NADH-quinone oxidoreductase subunit N|nr:NADH-quinone oxidoreductase subunit NuoN [Rhizomicrobium sp.]